MNYSFQYKAIAQSLYHALKDDPFYFTMEKAVGTAEQAVEAMLKYHDYSMCEAEKFGELFIPEGENFGASIWSLPLTPEQSNEKSAQKKAFLLQYMGEKALQTYNEICRFMSAQSDGLVDDSAWYLSILGIAPEFQGKGLGAGLITPVIEHADQAGVATFLETFTPRNMSFYQKLGYRDCGVFDEPTTGSRYWVMVREPA